MGNYQQRAVALYNSAAGGAAPTLTASGNSNQFDMHAISDAELIVTVGGAPTGTTPTLVVGVDIQDANGNWIPQVVKTASITAAGTTLLSAGLHAASPNQLVFSGVARVSWTITGTTPSFPNVTISLIGR